MDTDEEVSPEPRVVDNHDSWGDDEKMSTATDKDYIDAKVQAAATLMVGEIKAANAIMDGRLAVIEARMDGTLKSMDEKINANFARFEAILHKSNAEIHKGMSDTLRNIVAIVSGLVGLGIAVIVFAVNNIALKATTTPVASSAPIVIYAQPVPPAPATPASPEPAFKK